MDFGEDAFVADHPRRALHVGIELLFLCRGERPEVFLGRAAAATNAVPTTIAVRGACHFLGGGAAPPALGAAPFGTGFFFVVLESLSRMLYACSWFAQ